jgi:hypothetical protein
MSSVSGAAPAMGAKAVAAITASVPISFLLSMMRPFVGGMRVSGCDPRAALDVGHKS